jgi:IS30 family transposase
VLVATDKFTKWIEDKPIATHSADRVVTFICDILHRFGFPNTIITDLGSNFHSYQFCDFRERSSIEVNYVSVAHPWANGQDERANGLVLDGLKNGLYDESSEKGRQVDRYDLISSLGASYTTKQGHRIVTFLSGIQI